MSVPANRPIAVVGMHRSGTSMVTRALHDAGLHLVSESAEFIRAAEDNPEGFWEHKAIVACNDELLEATGGAWDNPPALPPQGADDPRVAALVPAAEEALAGLRTHAHWGFKDPRVCLTAPFWLDLEPELHFIVCLRHPLEVALSLKRRNQNSYSLGLALWERYYAAVLGAVPPERRLVSHYDAFFVDPDGELARVCEFAGLRPATARVRRDLRHHSIAVSLTDAGVSEELRTLYTTLCREAGFAAPPEAPFDEGRVHRLVLDGAVAAQHAEQRLAAIERLEERERTFRAQHAESEEALRARVRDLERQLSETRAVALRKVDEMARQVAVVQQEVTPGPVRRFVRRAVRRSAREARRVAKQARTSARPLARRVAHRLPEPARAQLRRARSVPAIEPGPVDADRGAPAPTTFARARLRGAADRLPPATRERLRVTRRRIRRARAAPVPTARRALDRMPPPAQAATRRIWRGSAGLRRSSAGLRRRWAGIRRPPIPKGPEYRHWKDAYQELVRDAVPAGATWLAVSPGSPAEVRTVREPPAARFPQPADASRDDLALVAQLDALRCAGTRYLVVPEGSREWLRRRAELRDHLVSAYHCVADEPGAGAVFDLAAPAAGSARSLHQEIRRLSAGLVHAPAVLDWTDLDLGPELAGVTTFRPPAGRDLPYLDDSVEIVVCDDGHDTTEARRVAQLGVIVVGPGPGGVEVRSVTELATRAPSSRPRVLVRSRGTDERWTEALAERASGEGADLALGDVDGDPAGPIDGYDVVVVVEPSVLPLPGAITAAAALATALPSTAVAGKVLDADGRIEAAGGTVFSDRSVALVAGGSDDVRAPWHDYVRPVCWAPGLVAAGADLWSRTSRTSDLPARTFLREWCASVWERGGTVAYDPAFVAVRVAGNGGEPSTPLHTSAWQRVLDLRPRRPERLADDDWRTLLAHDDVEACRA